MYSGHIGLFIKQTKTAKYGNEGKIDGKTIEQGGEKKKQDWLET